MLLKSFHSFLLAIFFLATEAMAQGKVTLRFIDEKTGAPVAKVLIVGSKSSSDMDGKLEVEGSSGDTIRAMPPDYPVHYVVLTNEMQQTVSLSSEITDESIFMIVDETAQFPGGMASYYQYVGKALQYPRDAARKRIEGKVFVEFIIGIDGQIEKNSVRAIHSPHPSLSAEAERVMRESPAWKPGIKNGRKVRQIMVLPYNFELG